MASQGRVPGGRSCRFPSVLPPFGASSVALSLRRQVGRRGEEEDTAESITAAPRTQATRRGRSLPPGLLSAGC